MNPQVASRQRYNRVPEVQSGMHSAPATHKEKYKTVLFNLGITEIALGTMSCLLGIVTLAIGSSWYFGLVYVGHGVWCGVMLIASGTLGAIARSKPSKCIYNANMVMSIVAANFMVVLVMLSSVTAAGSRGYRVVFHVIIALLGFAGLVITIVHSAYCCAGVCCLRKGPTYMYVVQPQAMVPVQMKNGQVMLYPVPAANPASCSGEGNPDMTMPQSSAAQPFQFQQAMAAQPLQFQQAMAAQPLQVQPGTAAQPLQFQQATAEQPLQI